MNPVPWGHVRLLSLLELFAGEEKPLSHWLKSDAFVYALADMLGLRWTVRDLRTAASPGRLTLAFTEAKSGVPVYFNFHLSGAVDEGLAWLLTQSVGQRAATLVLVCSRISKKQEDQVKWLNEMTPSEFEIYAVELSVLKLNRADVILPVVTAVVARGGAQRELRLMGQNKNAATVRTRTGLPFAEFWLAFNASLLKRKSTLVGQKPRARSWMSYCFDENFKLIASVDPGSCSAAVGLVISGDKYIQYYEQLHAMKETIEHELGTSLSWELKHTRCFSRVYVRRSGFDVMDRAQWQVLHLWFACMLEKFQSVFELKINILVLQDRFSSARAEGLQQKIDWENASSL